MPIIAPKKIISEWDDYIRQYLADVEVDTTETEDQKYKRIQILEANPEQWFKYYFPSYCSSEPADFHKKATIRLFNNTQYYEVRAWSRELAKSARSMFEVLHLALTGKIKNLLLVSNTSDNAERLLTPFRLQLEKNLRIINDYGDQVNIGHWESTEFIAKCGCSFRSLGAGQSPRGTRNEAVRPDFILIDDIDTDEECRNPERIKFKWEWIEKALIPTLSVSGKWRVLFNGNIIAKDCCIIRAIKMADHSDIINIRDKNGKSSWSKNSEEDIDKILSKISTKAAQGEYYNNPVTEGEIFKELTYGKIPPMRSFKRLILYGDPSPSNRTNKANSRKAVALMGKYQNKYYVINVRCDNALNADFVNWFYEIKATVPDYVQVYNYIENNSLQDPFYEQVIKPLFKKAAEEKGHTISIIPDTRAKPDKFSRIEGNLEPLNRDGDLIFNQELKGNPHMSRVEDSFLLLDPKLSAPADGADCVEGGKWILDNKTSNYSEDITIGVIRHSKKRV